MRKCNECSVCCYVARVELKESIKPVHTKCLHVINEPSSRKGSCGIFGQSCRPDICNSFICSWLGGFGQENDRPDKSGVMLSINTFGGGTWICVIELEMGAVLGSGREIILDAISRVNLPAIVVSYDQKPPNDLGDLVIVKSSLLPRAKSLIGAEVAVLADDVSVYELLNHKDD